MTNRSIQTAIVTTHRGAVEWHCPNCDQKLAEIVGQRVVIRVKDRTITLRSDLEPDQVCWKCGATSVYEQETAA